MGKENHQEEKQRFSTLTVQYLCEDHSVRDPKASNSDFAKFELVEILLPNFLFRSFAFTLLLHMLSFAFTHMV